MTNITSNATNQLADTGNAEVGSDILGIKPPVDIPTGWEWALYTLAALALIALLVFVTRRLIARAKIVKVKPVPQIPAHIIARRELEAALRLIDDPYRFCIAVSDALRGYIEGRFSLQAPDRTTDEFLGELRDSTALNSAQQDALADFLNQCDLVKFAKDEPARTDLEQLHRFALGLVEETMPGSAQAETAPPKPTAEVAR